MDQERNLGVTEARFGLTVVICLLVAIGYIVLLRLGSSSESSIEIRLGGETPPAIAREDPPHTNDDQPQVLNVEPEGGSAPLTSRRPDRPAVPQRGNANEPTETQRR